MPDLSTLFSGKSVHPDNRCLALASLKGAEDLSGELFRFTLALSLMRGGVLSRTFLSTRKASSAREIYS